MTAHSIPIAVPLPRVVIALRADGSVDILADRPCRVFLTGGLLGAGHAEFAPPRVGWAVVTAALEPDEHAKLETIARLYEGRPCDSEPAA